MKDSLDYLINIKSVDLRIGDRVLINNLDLSLKKGTRIGIIGPSGCGKTSLLRSIVNKSLNKESSSKRFEIVSKCIGYVPQEVGILPWYSLGMNFNIFSSHIENGGKKTWFDYIFSNFDLIGLEDNFPKQLSGGELQRAILACALGSRPELYCVDEPLTEVGLGQKWKILEFWSNLIFDSNSSLIIVSHDIDTLLFLSDEILILGGDHLSPVSLTSKFDLTIESHPREPRDLKNSFYTDIRNSIINTTY